MPSKLNIAIASVIGIDIGKNSFHVVGQDQRGAIVLRQKWSRGQVEARLANLPPWASPNRARAQLNQARVQRDRLPQIDVANLHHPGPP